MTADLYIIIMIACMSLASAIGFYTNRNREDEAEVEDPETKRKKEIAQIIKEKEEIFGQATLSICNIKYFILFFESPSICILNGEEIPFSKIMSYQVYDDNTVIHHSEGSQKTSTGSMLGRAVGGSILFGTAGAIAGATTASKESETVTKSTTSHNYSITIGIKELSNPIRVLEIGDDRHAVSIISNALQIITAQNS